MKLLIDNVEISVRVGQTIGQPFHTNVGIAQGDCLSAILFILYLAKALHYQPHLQDHNYNIPSQDRNQPEELQQLHQQSLTIPLQYADDCGFIFVSEDQRLMDHQMESTPILLERRNLRCNQTKTETYEITKTSTTWKSCKYLGSLLDTTQDIKRRKILTMISMQKLKHLWESRHVSLGRKLRIFNSCIKSIFLSQSELGTLTASLEEQINAFQRRLLRNVLNIKWPAKISNKELYMHNYIRIGKEVLVYQKQDFVG